MTIQHWVFLDALKALAALEQAVENNGADFVYKPHEHELGGSDNPDLGSCRYVHNGCPDCMIGHVLFGVGWDYEELDRVGVVATLAAHFPDRMSDDAKCILWAAQKIQDDGSTWGDALAGARLMAKELGVL